MGTVSIWGLSAGTMITKEATDQTIEFSWGLYCLIVLFLLLYVIFASVPTEGTTIFPEVTQ